MPTLMRYWHVLAVNGCCADILILAPIRKVEQFITANRQQRGSAGAGYDPVHVAIDDATRLAYILLLPDDKQCTALSVS